MAGGNKTESSTSAKTMVVQPSTNYRDHSHITDDDKDLTALLDKADAEGVKGTDQTFPVKLHQLLSGSDEDGFSHIVSWQPHGRSFIVKKHSEFVEKVLPCCFRQSKFASFQRQLNLYGFRRITQGRDKGGYYHELFLRGRTLLALKMQRTKVKGTGARKASSPETEPNFYSMPSVQEKKKATRVVASPRATMPVPATVGSPLSASSPILQASRLSTLSLAAAGLAKVSPLSYGSTGKPISSLATSLVGSPSSMNGRPVMSSSAFASAALPDTRREIMAQMLANANRLQNLRDASRISLATTLNTSASLAGNCSVASLSQRGGPLHLNGFGQACQCAVPAF